MSDFETELKVGFLEEASQLLADTEQCFLQLESDPGNVETLTKIFRLAHNLKGSAKAVGFSEVGEFTHELESFLLKLKNGDLPVTTGAVNLLLRCNDHIRQMVDTLKGDLGARLDHGGLLEELVSFSSTGGAVPVATPPVQAPEPEEAAPSVPDASAFPEETDPFAQLAEQTRSEVRNLVAQAPKAAPPPPTVSADESIRVSLARVEKLLNFVGEMVILQSVLKEQSSRDAAANGLFLRKTVHQLGKVTKEVQDISMSLRMVPLKQTFQKMQRIVRDTSASLGKRVQLVLEGEETELDKTVLERLGDPLVHLVRNAVDHGIESSEARLAAGKPEGGTVWLKAYHQAGTLVIEVRDDGGGLNPDKLRAKAVEKGILRPDARIPDDEAYQLIFASGFSTKTEVTDVSGRGVGMDVVKTNIEAIQGSIGIETSLGKGTCFKITLPLTLAISDGMVVKLENERYVIPLAHVHESYRPVKEDIQFNTGVGEVLMLRGENLPLHRLGTLLGRRPTAKKEAWEGIAIVIRTQAQAFAVLVDDIIGQSQVVIKQLGLEVKNVKGFGGSAILGDGRPALILELTELVQKSSRSATALKGVAA